MSDKFTPEADFCYECGSPRPLHNAACALREKTFTRAEMEVAVAAMRQACAVNGCYCACHSLASSRAVCVHCHPESFMNKVDPYCGMNAKAVARILALPASDIHLKRIVAEAVKIKFDRAFELYEMTGNMLPVVVEFRAIASSEVERLRREEGEQ
jgi:hypothetical protein